MRRETGALLIAAVLTASPAAARPPVPFTPPAMARQMVAPQDLRPPSIALDGLFAAIGDAHLFPDFKSVADATPDRAPEALLRLWRAERARPGFVLADFVRRHFTFHPPAGVIYRVSRNETVPDYIDGMWRVLTRGPDKPVPYSSLLPLPYPYVVPGGRFTELYYWDSYFTMIGLAESGHMDLVEDMVRDMASLIDRYGHVPNGTRTYYLSRSQPPFFALMVELLARHEGPQTLRRFLPEMKREYAYWMEGAERLAPGQAHRHVVRLADGTVLNRYWDDLDTPRDESYPEDIATAARSGRPPGEVYRDLRAAAESGWDFSSRWLADGHSLVTIHTTDLLPIDLNALLAHLEQTIARATDGAESAAWTARAQTRLAAIDRLMFDPRLGAWSDYDWTKGATTGVLSAATFMPLFLHLASQEQADRLERTLRARLSAPGGIVATTQHTGQQWDSPNGWAPLEWMAVRGLVRYGKDDLARMIAERWIRRVVGTWRTSGVFLEKYDVVSPDVSPVGGPGGGEYPMQIGFGWTNGTLLGLIKLYPTLADPLLADPPPNDKKSAPRK
ncbi:alpha,alpha-trehalase TreF [Acidomonas methanolica]|uniref:alpha,alpha-trehalase TreF n=1 Tax=Acidomonas methanolica TaxID=437 RepID=UPI00211A6EEB|nr:alpha,alpha-trehalase TreF [Acidomonas methanolica]MCQ9155571.1 alpha,alpha-trehalase TreF [Acidomonas methanolica]